MYPGTQSKMRFFFFFFFGGGGEGGDFYEDLTPKAHSTTLAKLWSTPKSNLPWRLSPSLVPLRNLGKPLRDHPLGTWELGDEPCDNHPEWRGKIVKMHNIKLEMTSEKKKNKD